MHKILKILAAVISLLGVIFLVRIVSKGDEAIKAAAVNGDTSILEPLAIVTYVVLAGVIGFVVFFVVKNLVTNTSGLKSTLIGIVAFVAILVVAYVSSDTINPVMEDGEHLYKYSAGAASSNEIKMSGAGLVAFYILLALAAGTMIFSGVKKVISK